MRCPKCNAEMALEHEEGYWEGDEEPNRRYVPPVTYYVCPRCGEDVEVDDMNEQ